ncbi:helicase [Aureococcus anophagefferens]|uniref:Helicase n=1 Tax=Aureococcus anophagefferens TaxID=44056 RepID=A0ABR1G248_AURAN
MASDPPKDLRARAHEAAARLHEAEKLKRGQAPAAAAADSDSDDAPAAPKRRRKIEISDDEDDDGDYSLIPQKTGATKKSAVANKVPLPTQAAATNPFSSFAFGGAAAAAGRAGPPRARAPAVVDLTADAPPARVSPELAESEIIEIDDDDGSSSGDESDEEGYYGKRADAARALRHLPEKLLAELKKRGLGEKSRGGALSSAAMSATASGDGFVAADAAEREFKRFAPGCAVTVYHGSQAERRQLRTGGGVLARTSCSRPTRALRVLRRHGRAARGPRGARRDGEAAGDAGGLNQLRKLLAPFCLRRVKADVLASLPTKTAEVVSVPLSATRARLPPGRGRRRALKKGLGDAAAKHLFTELRKAANHPLLLRLDKYDAAALARAIAKTLHGNGHFGGAATLAMVTKELESYDDFALHELCAEYADASGDGFSSLGDLALGTNALFESAKCGGSASCCRS